MRIAIIADTHNQLPPAIPRLLESADEIWHLGDVCDPSTLAEIEKLRRPLIVVRGNNDLFARWPLTLNLVRENIRFHLIHIPPAKAPAGCDVLLHGHTHIPRDDSVDGVRWMNPGCIGNPGRYAPPSFAWLTLDQGRIVGWEVIPFNQWNEKPAVRAS